MFSFLLGAAIGYALGTVIGEALIRIFIVISSYWNAKEEIQRKVKEQNSQITTLELVNKFIQDANTTYAPEVLEFKGLDENGNEVAYVNVTAEQGTQLRIGQRF